VGIALVAAILLWTFVVKYTTGPSGAQEVLRLHRNGGLVVDDGSLDRLLGGTVAVSSSAAVAAYCVNGWYWGTDETVDLDVVVASSDRLLNVAEASALESFPTGLVEEVEQALLDDQLTSPTIDDVPADLVAQFGRDEVAAYLSSVAGPADPATLQRFVVYAVSESTYRQRVVFVDLDHRDRDAVRRFMAATVGGADVRIAGSSQLVEVGQDDCSSVAAEGRYTPTPGR
jgi:hypothetical protein